MVEPSPLDLLDTNILVSYARRDALYQRIEVERGLLSLPADDAALVSIVTIGEINSLALRGQWAEAKREQLRFVLSLIRRVNLDAPLVLEAYSLLDVYSLDHGRRMGKNDLWIAASAYAMNATLVTTDDDFDHLCPQFIRLAKYSR